MKKSNRILTFLVALAITISSWATDDPKMDSFISSLMKRMTLTEKLGQLNLSVADAIVTGQAKSSNVASKIEKGEVGGLFNIKGVGKIRDIQKFAIEKSRLKIPLLFGMDVIHGYETIFPIPFGLACTWDMDAIEESARIAAQESTADGICWTFSPMVDICRDQRWGRVSEGSGEDPFLGSAIAKAMIRGYQGKSLTDKNTLLSCVKHFALYGAPEGGRDYNTVDMSRLSMYNDYFPPYKAAVEAGAGSVMTSFNVVDGIPATGNHWLLTEVLRNQWGFKGFVVTDYTAISEMIDHGMGDLQQVSAQALHAGTDMDMVSDGFIGTIEKSLKEGKIKMSEIDRACRLILEAKYKLGLFDDPYKYCDLKRPAEEIFTTRNRAIARRIAAESFVLLKNDGDLLPLKAQGKIAVVGPLANTKANMPGTWSVAATPDCYNSLLEGIRNAVGNQAEVLYAKGSNLMHDAQKEAWGSMFGREIRDNRSAEEMLKEALAIANQSDVIIAAVGEGSEMSGECSSRSDLNLPDAQRELLIALKNTGIPVILVNFSGRNTTMTWECENFPSILNVWFGGSEAADAICDVIFGKVSPSGKLCASMPKSVGQVPLYYNHLNTGRPLREGKWFEKFRSNYLDIDNDPLFPFGYGLSYTRFDYSNFTLSSQEMKENGKIVASVIVKNSGNYDGAEVVQLYIRDLVGTISRPLKELKGFERINLKKGESRTVTFEITPEMLKFYNSKLQYVAEKGDFEVMVGTNSHDVRKLAFTLK